MNRVLGRLASVPGVLGVLCLLAAAPTGVGQVWTIPGNYAMEGVSDDGRAAAGGAYVWTLAVGRNNDLPRDPGFPNFPWARGISGDGSTVFGGMSAAPNQLGARAFRWRGTGTAELLTPILGLPNSRAAASNRDGSVLVGDSYDSSNFFSEAFIWDEERGMRWIRDDLGGFHTEANGVSADGRRVVGTSDGEFSFAFVWEESTGMRALPSLSTGFGDARASAINAAGDVFVGTSASRAVLWRNERITDLGMLDGRYQTVAYGVNATGTVVVGDGSSSPFLRDNGFVWTPERGMEHLSAYLGALGVALPVGSELSRVYGVSPDGRTFAGGGRFGGVSAGFVITIPTPGALGVGLVACFLGAGRRRP